MKSKLNKQELIEFIMAVKKNGDDIAIKLQISNQEKPEIIMNYNASIDTKLKYYIETYDDNLIHKNNSEIRIIDAFGMKIPF